MRDMDQVDLAAVSKCSSAPDPKPSDDAAAAGGHLLTAPFLFLVELLPPPSDSAASRAATAKLATTLKQNLSDLMERDEQSRPRLTSRA